MSALVQRDARVKLACLAVYVAAALHARAPAALGICLGEALAVALAVRLDVRSVFAATRPLVAVVAFTVIMQVFYLQQGDVVVRLGPVLVTRGALEASAVMLCGLACVLVASVAFMRCTPSAQLVFAFGWFASPLRAFGVRVDAFMLALSVAFRFVFVLADDFSQLKRAQLARAADFGGGVRIRLATYVRLFAPLVRESFRRADRLADSFLARCFGAVDRRTTLESARPGARDALLAVTTALLALAAFLV